MQYDASKDGLGKNQFENIIAADQCLRVLHQGHWHQSRDTFTCSWIRIICVG